jgi:hypothetical protein
MRIRLVLATAAIGLLGGMSLAACARSDTSALTPEGQALVAMGFDSADLVAAGELAPDAQGLSPAASAKPGKHRLRPGRVTLRKNVLHGEAVVQADTGTKTVDVQRGSVTAIDDKTVTVKSTDGFTLTWTFGTPLHVIEHRTSVQPTAIKVGTEIGIAGTKDGSTVNAHLIVIPTPR